MATILKNDRLTQSGQSSHAVTFNVEDVQVRAGAYLEEIRKQARQILDEATRQADSLREEACQQGKRQASEDIERIIQERATQLSDQRCKTATAACQESLAQLNEETTQWLHAWRDTTIGLACAMAEKLVRHSMQEHVETLKVWMEEALTLMRESREIRVLVHPDDFSIAGRYLQHMGKQIPQAAHAEIIPDPTITPGGCIVKSKHGQIDQQLETQLKRLADQLQ